MVASPFPLVGDGEAQAALVDAVQRQAECVPTPMVSSPPPAATAVPLGETLNRHGAAS